jgi:hypothetical protein
MAKILEASLSLAEYGAHMRLLERYRVLGPLVDNDALHEALGGRGDEDRRAVTAVIDALWERDTSGRLQPSGAASSSLADDFEQFYYTYPRRKGRLHAQRAYARARKIASHNDIMLGLSAYLEACKGAEAAYIKHPATWLNSGGWMDEPDENRSPLLQSVLRSYQEYADA